MKIEKQLGNLAADLITGSDKFVLRLFNKPPGAWFSVLELCQDLETQRHGGTLQNDLQRILDHKKVKSELYVTWLEYPDLLYGVGYALIIFFLDNPFWNTTAIYNRAHVLKKSSD